MSKPETMMIDDVKYVREDSVKPMPELSNRVIVRCYYAGVHVGTLVKRDAVDTVLENANNIWRWAGAHDISEVALKGVDRESYTRISPMVPEVTLTTSDTCQIIPVAEGVDLTEVFND